MPGDVDHDHLQVDDQWAHAWRYGDGEPAAILIHGLASQARELGALPQAIADQGLTVLAIDLRGHGQSQGPRGLLDPDRILTELAAWRDHLDDDGHELALVGGHSLGGAWALMAAPELDAQATMAACTPGAITAELGALEHAAYRIGGAAHKLASRLGYDALSVPYRIGPEDVLDDPEAQRRMREEALIQPSIPLANVDALLELDAAAWAKACTCPGLIAVAERDRVVDQANTRTIHDAYAGPKEWLELPGPHACFYGPTGETCAKQVAGWVGEVVG